MAFITIAAAHQFLALAVYSVVVLVQDAQSPAPVVRAGLVVRAYPVVRAALALSGGQAYQVSLAAG